MSHLNGPRGVLALIGALGATAAMATSASAATSVAYSNLNTVPATVNGTPNEDTFAEAPFGFPFGGQIETAKTGDETVKSLTVQLDSFVCEYGSYNLENCYTLKPKKTFKQQWVANIYAVVGNEPAELVATSVANFKIPYRPTTNVSCPATPEGKGFGANCDVGGLLTQDTFKKFTQYKPLPRRVIILLSSGSEVPVNVGTESSYKEYANGEYIAEGPLDGGVPSVGTDPLPDGVYLNSKLEASGWAEFQPVFQLNVK